MPNLLFYSTHAGKTEERLRQGIEGLVPNEKIHIYRTIDSLSRRLHQSCHDIDVAVLLATAKEELSGILSVRELLVDVRIILVLPDQDKETIKKGHTLWPRFLTYASSDFSDVAAVLRKMLQNSDPGSRKKEEIVAT